MMLYKVNQQQLIRPEIGAHVLRTAVRLCHSYQYSSRVRFAQGSAGLRGIPSPTLEDAALSACLPASGCSLRIGRVENFCMVLAQDLPRRGDDSGRLVVTFMDGFHHLLPTSNSVLVARVCLAPSCNRGALFADVLTLSGRGRQARQTTPSPMVCSRRACTCA